MSKQVKRNLFVCDTPYQTFNAINIVWHQKREKSTDKAINHIMLVNQFDAAAFMAEKLEKSKLFDAVILVKKEDRQAIIASRKRHLLVAKDYLFPRSFFRRHTKQSDFSLLMTSRYDSIYSAVMSHFAVTMLNLNRHSDYIRFDDGTGSYFGSIAEKGVQSKYHKVAKLLTHGNALREPSIMLLNQPEMYSGLRGDFKICSLPRMDDGVLSFLSNCFDSKGMENIQEKFVYLTQPIMPQDMNEKANQLLLQCFKEKKDEVLIRLHPRDINHGTLFQDFKVEAPEKIWELRIAQVQNLNDIVLVSFFSTAQFTPKLLFGKEPFIIFMYYLHPSFSKETCEQYHKIIDDFKKFYNKPERIFEPRNIDELCSIIGRFYN